MVGGVVQRTNFTFPTLSKTSNLKDPLPCHFIFRFKKNSGKIFVVYNIECLNSQQEMQETKTYISVGSII